MAADGKDPLEDLMKSSEAILEEADTLDVTAGPLEEVRALEKASIEVPEAGDADGRCEITVSKDAMTALADFFPPSGSGEPLGLSAFEVLLHSSGILYGIDLKPAREAILKCAMERMPIPGVPIARGKAPESERASYLVVEPSLLESPKKADAKESIDHKATSPFRIVKKGDTLARLIPRQEGAMGIDVRGTAIRFGLRKVDYPKAGKNTSWASGGTVMAKCDGRFDLTREAFGVNQVLDILGDVDYSTGHIDFPGDVIVKGEIQSGFNVHAGGSIWCAKMVDATDIVCSGDLLTNQGILGRGKGSVRAGGWIKARFVENCLVEAGGTVNIHFGCINSAIRTLDRLEMGPPGVIIGGTVFALRGVTATQIGSASGTRTEINCGTDYAVQRKILLIRDRNATLAQKIKNLERLAATGQAAGPQVGQLRERLKGAIDRFNEIAHSLVASVDTNDTAEVSVRGTVFPGTLIQICHVRYVVSAPMSCVRFRLDKEKGQITVNRGPQKAGKIARPQKTLRPG